MVLMAALLVLGGCATTGSENDSGADAQQEWQQEGDDAAAGETDQASTEGTGESADPTAAPDCPPNCDFRRDAIADKDSALADRTIYFEFDSSEVQQQYMAIIERHAAYLSQYGDVEVRLEGHTDERGSREYNIGLGARRAESVAQLMQAFGVAETQLETVSYGEEVPAVEGPNEEAWAQNRRVELVYPGVEQGPGADDSE
jgi:peptidoglycan-associated lipoprotein